MNTGVLTTKPKKKDYIAGIVSGIVPKKICDDWTPYLPSKERQNFKYFDSSACVSFSLLNAIETQMNFLIKENKLSKENLQWLIDTGYIGSDGLFNGSDRALAKMSGTTPRGNYMNVVAETARTLGILPEKDWSWSDDFNWDKYYATITANLNKGLEWVKRFKIMYEWVLSGNSNLSIGLDTSQAPIQIAANWWSNPVNGVIPANGCGSGHATIIYKVDDLYRDFDSYDPFYRNLAKDYCIPYAMRIIIEEIKDLLPQNQIEIGLKNVLSYPIPPFNWMFGLFYPGGRANWALAHRKNIFNLYIQLLNRIPEPFEVDGWLRYSSNINIIRNNIFKSPEYISKH